MSRRGREYSKEFKREAIDRSIAENGSLVDLAGELGITPARLYQWRSEYFAHSDEGAPQGETPEEEVVRLRRELTRARQERDILKKAVTFFAQHPE
jgi:transposase